MTGMTDSEIIEAIIAREGGYVDHPNDKGGPTNFGITLETLRAYRRNPHLTSDDVRRLNKNDARQIYRDEYIVKPGFHLITDDHLRAHVIDFGVHSGPGTAAIKLQQVVGVKQDGIIGPDTMNAIRRMGAAKASNLLMAERIKLFGRVVSKDHSQAAFISGWLNRALEFMI